MVDIEELIYQDVKAKMANWNQKDIYAVSFFVHVNEEEEYEGYSNLCDFSISYNTEADCAGAGEYDEERWNYAFWRQNETPIIDIYEKNECMKQLMTWYEENQITDLGVENEDCYNSDGDYIGKGPVGEYELFSIVSDVAARLQSEHFLSDKIGKKIPIIVHDIEYNWFAIEATKKANPNGEADIFLESIMKDIDGE